MKQFIPDEYEKLYDEPCEKMDKAWEGVYREWRRQCHGKRFKIRTYGLCHWNKVIFLWKKNQEFYKLERDTSILWKTEDKDILRKEYFQGELKREYLGWQSCFVEFFEFLQEYHTISPEKFSLATQALDLDKETANLYIEFYKQCFF